MGGRHRIDAAMARIADPAAAALSVLAFYVAGFGVFDDSMVSAGTVTLALLIGFLTHRRGEDEDRDEGAGTRSPGRRPLHFLLRAALEGRPPP